MFFHLALLQLYLTNPKDEERQTLHFQEYPPTLWEMAGTQTPFTVCVCFQVFFHIPIISHYHSPNFVLPEACSVSCTWHNRTLFTVNSSKLCPPAIGKYRSEQKHHFKTSLKHLRSPHILLNQWSRSLFISPVFVQIHTWSCTSARPWLAQLSNPTTCLARGKGHS